MSDDPNGPPKLTPTGKRAQDFTQKSALALELPFTIVGAVLVGGVLGYFLDKWLHTAPWLTLVLGGVGFIGGVREVIRRLPGDGSGSKNG